MIPVMIAGHHACQIEYRDTRTVQPGHVASFEVNNTCVMDTLTIVADNDYEGITLIGVNHRKGHDLTVRIRIPRWVKDDTVLYPFAYAGTNPYSSPIADLPPITIT